MERLRSLRGLTWRRFFGSWENCRLCGKPVEMEGVSVNVYYRQLPAFGHARWALEEALLQWEVWLLDAHLSQFVTDEPRLTIAPRESSLV